MLIGCYYRCPIVVEEGDREYPRFFVLAQVEEYNELADAVKVKMHDLLGSREYYNEIFNHDVFRADSITRCEAVPGGIVNGSHGKGIIISRSNIPFSEDEPYWYWIKLTNGDIIKACETELMIEYSQMNFDPCKQLRSYEFQHPTWFINHLKVSQNLHLINHASYGFKTLTGCRTFLLPHQVMTVSRCFETRPIRYMLADEVGLGKTVEACSILNIMANENRKLRTLIVVPGALANQWKNELYYKYTLKASVSSVQANICILSMEDLENSNAIINAIWDLLIVDETHRLLSHDIWYQIIEALSRKIEHILLLSATPIQDRNEEYHRLLTLLSPQQYSEMDSQEFAMMIKKQKRIQKKVNQQLSRLDRYDEYYEIIIDNLKSIAETLEDKSLIKLIHSINIESEDKGLEIVKQSLSYICENYRVERKVIRNRRQSLEERLAKRVLCAVPYSPLSLNENYNEIEVIQNTLAYLAENDNGSKEYVVEKSIPLLSALFSSPWAYEEEIHRLCIDDSSLISGAATWKRQAENEHQLVNIALDEDPDLIKGRLMVTMNYIDQETDILDSTECKIVVFTSHNATLLAFLNLFNSRYNNMNIYAVPFGKHMNRSQLEDSVYSFQNDPACRLIVCDETGGEGRNFQNAEMLIHLDMPWNANTVEQRIGRLDRLGREPDSDVLSVIIYAEQSIEEQLYHIWRDGMKLFEQSLSGLEIITGELNDLIISSLQDDYYNGLTNAFSDIVDQADEMRESVEDEQIFDLGVTLYRPMSNGISNVLNVYSSENDRIFTAAMMGWGSQAGLRAERPTSDGLIEFRESAFSFNAARQSLFIPPDWDRYNDSSIMQRERKILGSFDRKTAAVREDILFFAPGDAVYDSIISNAVGCNRGRCSAIGTLDEYNYTGIVFIYNIEPELDELLNSGLSLQTLEQFKMYLSLEQIIVPIPLTMKSKDISEKKVVNTLFSISSKTAEHLGRRSKNKMVMSPIERFITKTPASMWEPLVDKCSTIAYKKAMNKMKETSDLATAKKEMQRILNGYRAESMFFNKDNRIVEEKAKIFNATLKALSHAKPNLDAVCFLKVKKNG